MRGGEEEGKLTVKECRRLTRWIYICDAAISYKKKSREVIRREKKKETLLIKWPFSFARVMIKESTPAETMSSPPFGLCHTHMRPPTRIQRHVRIERPVTPVAN